MPISFHSQGLGELRDKIRSYSFQRAALTWGKSAQIMMLEAIREQAPEKTGELKRRMTSRMTPGSGSVNLSFFSGVPYSDYVLYGTRSHLIPKEVTPTSKILKFEANGETIYRQQVHHPGTKANPFVEKAWARIYPAVYQSFQDSVTGELSRLI